MYFQLHAKNNLFFSQGIENPHYRRIPYSLQTTSYKKEYLEYQHGEKAKRVFLPKFPSFCITILRCLQKLQPIKVTKFESGLSTFFSF